jgi:hypothetical protein
MAPISVAAGLGQRQQNDVRRAEDDLDAAPNRGVGFVSLTERNGNAIQVPLFDGSLLRRNKHKFRLSILAALRLEDIRLE